MQLTQGWVLLIDGKTLAYQSIPQLTRGLAQSLKRRPPKGPLPIAQSIPSSAPEPTPASPPEETWDARLQVQLFNFGRVMADLENLDMVTFERAMQQYFPDVPRIPWAAEQIRLAAEHLAEKHTATSQVTETPSDPKTKARLDARRKAEAETLHPGQVNVPGKWWYHDDCGRVSDCLINTETGVELHPNVESICPDCQRCMDDQCPIRSPEDHIADDLQNTEPLDIEPDEDSSWTTPAIVLNERGERIGTVNV